MVLFTPKKLTFKGSKKQHQILTQTAYYQAGKIVVQTILPEQPPVALITLNTLGTTCSTSADTYIPIENIYNTQSCSFLESRLVSLYGGKAASLLIEYQQRFTFPYHFGLLPLYPAFTPIPYKGILRTRSWGSVAEKLAKQKLSEGLKIDITTKRKTKLINNAQSRILYSSELTLLQKKAKDKTRLVRTCFAGAGNNIFQSTLGNIEIQTATRLARIMVNYCNFYSLNKTSLYSLFTKYALFPKTHQLNLLSSKVAINSCFLINFDYLSQYSDTEDPLGVYPYGLLPLRGQQLSRWQSKERLSAITSATQLRVRSMPVGVKATEGLVQQAQYLPHTQRAFTPIPYKSKGSVAGGTQGKRGVRGQEQGGMEYLLPQHEDLFVRQPQSGAIAKKSEAKGYAKYKYNIRVWAIKLNGKDKTPQENIIYRVHNNFYFAIVQSKNSLKICENKNSSYNIQRLSVENIGNYSQLNNSNFQLINSLQFSNLQRDRFYPNWFRLYLPDMEATKFLKNVANYYFSLGLQTLTFPSTKSSYNFTHYKSSICTSNASRIFTSYPKGKKYTKQSFTLYYKLATQLRVRSMPVGVKDKSSYKSSICTYKICTASPFLTFLNKNTQKEKYKLFIPNIISYSYCPPSILVNSTSYKSTKRGSGGDLTLQNSQLRVRGMPCKGMQSEALQMPRVMKVDYIKNPSFTKVTKNQLEPLNVPFSLLLENQIFPLNYNGFSIVEKELLYNALVNSSFAKAFYLINQNRQLLDFFVDYLLRFQILRQHQILYLFSTLLLGCNKIA